ncbi:hypothetical protein TNCV_33471 [Trichonephila clavipes]|nr:hypothetical protein TNCV_33471 [Trichonephila clavipes]
MSTKLARELNTGGFAPDRSPDRNICSGPKVEYTELGTKISPSLRTKNRRTLAGRRLAWKRLLEAVEAHLGLSNHRGRKSVNLLGNRKKITMAPRDCDTRPHLKKKSPRRDVQAQSPPVDMVG